jgi:hypothetical protein
MKVFLDGTCNSSNWRDKLLKNLKMDYFNPVVEHWNEEARRIEELEKVSCDYTLFTITPKMTGVYSIAEVVDLSNKHPKKTILVILDQDTNEIFVEAQMKSLKAVADLVEKNGSRVFYDLYSCCNYLNKKAGF